MNKSRVESGERRAVSARLRRGNFALGPGLATLDSPGALRLLPPRWVLLSLAAHALVIAFARGLPAPEAPQPRLEVRLAMPRLVAPAVTAAAVPSPAPRPKAEPVVHRQAPAPILTRREAPASAPSAPSVAQAPASAESAPATVPASPRPAAAAPLAAVPRIDDGAVFRSDLAGYGESFGRWLARHRSYPRMAQIRGWQGQVEVRVHVAKKGSVIDVVVTRSSGFEVLDRQALDMVKQADPLPDLPNSLKGQEFTLDIPITFRLEAS